MLEMVNWEGEAFGWNFDVAPSENYCSVTHNSLSEPKKYVSYLRRLKKLWSETKNLNEKKKKKKVINDQFCSKKSTVFYLRALTLSFP